MTRLSLKKGEPKASIIDGLVASKPGQDVVVTAVQNLYLKSEIKGFIREYVSRLIPGEVVGSGANGQTFNTYLKEAAGTIGRAFERFNGSEEFSGPVREKWMKAVLEASDQDGTRGQRLRGMLRGGRQSKEPAGIFELVPAG